MPRFPSLGRPTLTMKTVKSLEQRVEILQGLVRDGVRDPRAREIATKLVATAPDRDEGTEIFRIFWFVKANVRYTHDIHGIDTYQSALRTLEFGGGDCFPAGAPVLTDDFRLVPIEHLARGMRIWGLDRWSEVTNVTYKGVLPVDAIRLNNGSWLKLTGTHDVPVAVCTKHAVANGSVREGTSKAGYCSCPVSEREVVRTRVSDLHPGDVLLAPERLPFGSEEMDADRAYVEGLYLAGGWCEDYHSSISGKGDSPKEATKLEVERICSALGVPTTWVDKHLRIRDSEWTQRLSTMGTHAPQKHMLSLNLGEGAAAAYLRGIMAGSGANTKGSAHAFTTTSRQLWLQTRILHKMLGMTCGSSYIEDHGGFGGNPVWRLTARTPDRKDGHAEKLLRVREIEREVMSIPTYNITTDDHYVYLPEADVTVAQCDDHAVVLATLLSAIGFQTGFRVISTQGKTWEHIYALAGIPKRAPSKLVALDTTVPSSVPGWQPPQISHKKDFFPINIVG